MKQIANVLYITLGVYILNLNNVLLRFKDYYAQRCGNLAHKNEYISTL